MTVFLASLAIDQARQKEKINFLQKEIKFLSSRLRRLTYDNAYEVVSMRLSKMKNRLLKERRNLKFMKSLEGEKKFHQFMKLPPEIQRMILKLVLVGFKYQPVLVGFKYQLHEYERVNYLALFRTTHYLFRESAHVFYGQECFTISNSYGFKHLDAFESADTAFSRNIRHLTLYIDLVFAGTDLPYILGALDCCRELRTLRLVLHARYYCEGKAKELQQLRSLILERPSLLNTIVVDIQERVGHQRGNEFLFEMRQILCTTLEIV